jgi:class 3 adenylate cyclase
VSVLFGDLVSFTTLSERRDAEDMRALMDAYFAAARTAIERHGGVVEKFIGDAVMAVWGTPVTHEDDAERAVRAALELVDAVAGLGASMGVPLQVRAGVLTGEAATAPDAGNQGMVTGDMVNTAARLQAAAPPGGVFVGQATYRAASGAIAFEEVGDLTLKGKEEPVRAWRALRVVAERQGQNRMAIEPPFVGRAEELRLMKDLLHATGREGRSRVVSVLGVGGIGKSRLAWELQKYVDGLSEDTYWHHGRCPSYGDGVTFWALGEMVRMRAGVAETDAPGVSRSKLTAAIALFVPLEDERAWIEPRLAFLLGLGERPAGGREELFAAWRTFFERISDHGTVAMVFEDLQWADSGLLDFIESLLEWSRAKPIYVVALTRPEITDVRPTWAVGQRSFLALHLEPLSDPTMGELVRGLVPDADSVAVDRIVARAEGMPLYAVEMIRMLADSGVLRAAEGAYELVGDLGDIQVPETLHALIASRLDALGAEDRALVQDAAILGKSFTLHGLVAVTGGERGHLEGRLHDLARREFVVYEADPRSPERGQYAFVQSIIREVAYGMLSKADRRDRHLAAAHLFEAEHDDELAGVVAAHYVEALHAAPEGSDTDGLADRAREWLARAAARATALGSPVQALGYVAQALDLTPGGPARAALLVHAADAAADSIRPAERIAYLKEAIQVLHVHGDRTAEVVAMGRLALALADEAEVDELRPLARRMRDRIGDDEDPLAQALADHAEASVHYYDGEFERCLLLLDRAAAGYERALAWDLFGRPITEKVYVLATLGRRRESRLLLQGKLAVATEENNLRDIMDSLFALGLYCQEWTESLRLAQQAAAVARQGGYGSREVGAMANGLEVAVETGAWQEADLIIESLTSRPDLPQSRRDYITLSASELAAYRGDHDLARTTLAEVSEETVKSADHTVRTWYRRVSAMVFLLAGELAEAHSEAMAVFVEEPGGPNSPPAAMTGGHAALWLRDPERARQVLAAAGALEEGSAGAVRLSIEAGILALDGHVEEARRAYEAVLAGRLSAGDRFAHAFITVDAVTVLPPGQVPEGAVETARAYLEGLGAVPLLDRLGAAAPAAGAFAGL